MSDLKLTPKQDASLKQLKECMKDVAKSDWDDYYYSRWLTARSWDAKKAEKMLREDVEWREKNDMDQLMDWTPPEVLLKYFPGGYFGKDREGFPIWFDTYGTIDQKGMMYCTTKKEMLKYKVWYVEVLFRQIFPECSKQAGKRIAQGNVIFDMAGISMKHLWKPALVVATELLQILEAHYPDTLKTAYIINAPAMFPVAFSIAKPFLQEYTRSKIQVLTGDWKSYLLKHFDADQLPVHWGGTATGPDGNEFCNHKISMGGKIPESYRIDNFLDNVDMSQFVTVTIKPGSSLQLDFEVTVPNSIISWQFKSEGNDVGFGVFKRTAEGRQKAGEMEEVVKSERVNSHLVPDSGEVICKDKGIYVLRFDNTYSWVNGKKLQYLVDIHVPDEGEEINYITTKL